VPSRCRANVIVAAWSPPTVDDYRSGRREPGDRAVRAAWGSGCERVRSRPGRTRAGGSPRREATWVDPVRRPTAVGCARAAGAELALNGYRDPCSAEHGCRLTALPMTEHPTSGRR
jgi:hypothetical protein